jgi:shikimate kinase
MSDAPKPPKKPIALVGLMGAGKSTVGRRLARRLGLPFVDADRQIEAAAGLTVAEIFGRFGEAQFRQSERNVIARLVEGPPRVIATGGGAFMDDGTRALILERCVAIWLNADVEVLAGRASRGGGRPLLNGDPIAALRTLAEARNPIYAEAHLTVSTDEAGHGQVVSRIVAALASR